MQDYHSLRRHAILHQAPNIKLLFGPEWKSKWISIFGLFIPQIYISLNIHKLSTFYQILVTYTIGATLTQALFLAIHELSHNLFFRDTHYNKLFSILLNLPIGVPFSISFRDYHLEHHRNLGIYGLDTDLPTAFEKKYIKGTLLKTLWLSLQIVTYSVRPILVKSYKLTNYHYLNIFSQVAFNSLIYNYYGMSPLIYYIMCDLIAGGLHPCAYHFISEHYLLSKNSKSSKQETFSYYGLLNYLTWNVGYHNEHHDFPYVPWSRLSKVRKIVKEYSNDFYENIVSYDSWYKIFSKFIINDDVSLNDRKLNY